MMTGDTQQAGHINDVPTRKAIVVGQFYPAGADACREEIERYMREAARRNSEFLILNSEFTNTRADYVGGIVPHAGWRCSGAVAARVFAALRQNRLDNSLPGSPSVIVLFGGVHRYRGRSAAMFTSGRWDTPLGPVEIDSALCQRIFEESQSQPAGSTGKARLQTLAEPACRLITDDPQAHENEHSLEVQMPFVRHVFPDAKVVPIMVPIDRTGTGDASLLVGEAVGRALRAYGDDAMIIGTTDLTHYGSGYGYTPHGVGAEANAWAKDVNDRRFVELVCSLKADELAPEASSHRNACNSGAAAATVAACVTLGATRGVLLELTSSYEVLRAENDTEQVGTVGLDSDSVGYAGIVFEKSEES